MLTAEYKHIQHLIISQFAESFYLILCFINVVLAIKFGYLTLLISTFLHNKILRPKSWFESILP